MENGSDMESFYIFQNAGRIMRALFEICLKKGWPIMASRLLALCKTVDKRLWGFETPLRQFPVLSAEVLSKIEARKLSIDKLREMDSKEIGNYCVLQILDIDHKVTICHDVNVCEKKLLSLGDLRL